MNGLSRSALSVILCLWTLPVVAADPKLDTAAIDAALGRTGAWTAGVYMVNFPRPQLRVVLQGVRLSDVQVLSFATFVGGETQVEMMGEICALPNEVSPAIAALRAAGVDVTGLHNHFIGESPRILFVHFMAHGPAGTLAQAFRAALAVTATPLRGSAPDFSVASPPAWARAVQKGFARTGGYYMTRQETLEFDIPSTHFPAGPMMDFWSSVVFFQKAPNGKVASTGDIMVTASELNAVLSILERHKFQIMAVHNHMIDEEPRVFFVHFWKIAPPQSVAEGLDSALAAAHAR